MKTFVRFVLVLALCHLALVGYGQQLEERDLRRILIPGLGIHLDQLPNVKLTVPYITAGRSPKIHTHKRGAQSSPSLVIMDEQVPDGAAVPVSAFEEITDPLIRKYAEMINKDAEEIDNYPLYRFVDAWYGVRYRWGGNDKRGIDCSALSRKLYDSIYGCTLARTSKQQHRQCERVKHVADAEEGDLIFFKMNRFRISHVGVYLANGYFLHASKSHGVMISNLSSKYWHRRYAGCGRVERPEKDNYESQLLQ